ncbi:MAG: Vi polysaccharide biosynthesis protein VipB/TviC [Betaproteobacteria bacterium RIFCSPLOWO2_02_FULL_65_24]|nr:MAG: Vi polysaccharide biosynthesis protein VipB/TviC [Betaproteobacteria bacterium RIFCSPLOWO2_02_FULL_65_24]
MKTYEHVQEELRSKPRTWLVTGAAGFIGSHLLETLLKLGQKVVGLDNFSTGRRENLMQVRRAVGDAIWRQVRFIEGDIRSLEICRNACRSVDIVLHQAALGSVPRSIQDPLASHESNVTGFLNVLLAARDVGPQRFVYASSSAAYGDHSALPKVEERIGSPLSPYAVTKYANELYAEVFARCYGFNSIGLRYFNVFGPRQDPNGAYAAVIPKWITAMMRNETVCINGDGETARDFCYVDNAVQANILAATVENSRALNHIYNVALNERTSLNELYEALRRLLAPRYPGLRNASPVHREFRRGDVRYSQADISKAQRLLGYSPQWRVEQGLARTVEWYVAKLAPGLEPQQRELNPETRPASDSGLGAPVAL